MMFWMKDINYVFSEGPLTKGYYYKTQRILYSKDSIAYYTKFEDIMRSISIFIYNKELQLFYSFALCITFNSKLC